MQCDQPIPDPAQRVAPLLSGTNNPFSAVVVCDGILIHSDMEGEQNVHKITAQGTLQDLTHPLAHLDEFKRACLSLYLSWWVHYTIRHILRLIASCISRALSSEKTIRQKHVSSWLAVHTPSLASG